MFTFGRREAPEGTTAAMPRPCGDGRDALGAILGASGTPAACPTLICRNVMWRNNVIFCVIRKARFLSEKCLAAGRFAPRIPCDLTEFGARPPKKRSVRFFLASTVLLDPPTAPQPDTKSAHVFNATRHLLHYNRAFATRGVRQSKTCSLPKAAGGVPSRHAPARAPMRRAAQTVRCPGGGQHENHV